MWLAGWLLQVLHVCCSQGPLDATRSRRGICARAVACCAVLRGYNRQQLLTWLDTKICRGPASAKNPICSGTAGAAQSKWTAPHTGTVPAGIQDSQRPASLPMNERLGDVRNARLLADFAFVPFGPCASTSHPSQSIRSEPTLWLPGS